MLTKSNFKCERCGDCCRYLTVKISKEDILAIRNKGFKGFFVFDAFIKSDVLKRDDAGCVFFDKEKCSCKIYDVRPSVCKGYPFVESDEVESCKPALMGDSNNKS